MTITVKTPKGTEVKVSYEYSEKVIDDVINADGDIIGVRKKIFKNDVLSFTVGEKIYVVDEENVSDYMTGAAVERCRELNVNKYYRSNYETNGRAIFVFDQETVNKIDELINQTVNENRDDEVKKIEDAQNEKKNKAKKEHAKEIIEKAKTTIKNADGTLMNASQARAYRESWNNRYNEGGEGYIPEIITSEMLEKAQKILS